MAVGKALRVGHACVCLRAGSWTLIEAHTGAECTFERELDAVEH